MPALFPRLKVWVANEVLTYTDLNAEFDNILANLEADTLGGYSASVAQMRLQVNPGGVGSESLAASISGEIERLRFAIARITGKTYWYESPVKNLSTSFVKARHIFCPISLNNEPIQQTPVGDLFRAGLFPNQEGGTLQAALAGAGKFSAGSLGNIPFLAPASNYELDPRCNGGSLTYSFWIKGYALNETILSNRLIGLRAFINASGYLQVDITKPTTSGANKEVVSVTGNVNINGSSSYRHVLIAYKLTNSTADTLAVYLDGVLSGTPISGVAIHGNVPRLNYCALINTDFSGTSSINTNMNGLPETLGWTKTTTGGSASVSNGVLSVSNAGGQTQYWSITPASTGAAASNFVEFKLRITGYPSLSTGYTAGQIEQDFSIILKSGSFGSRLNIGATSCTIQGSNNLGFGTTTNSMSFNHNFHEWTHVIFNVDIPLGVTSVVVNGRPAGVISGGVGADASAAALIFGKTTTNGNAASYELEYIRSGVGFGGLGGYTPANTCALSDLAVLDGVVTDSGTLAALQTSSPFAIFGEEVDKRIRYASNRSGEITTGALTVAGGASATIPAASPAIDTFSDGLTPIRVSFDFDAVLAVGAGAFNASVWLRAEGNPAGLSAYSSGSTTVLQSVLGTAGMVDAVIGQRFFNIPTIPVGLTLPICGTVNTVVTLPAGEYRITPAIYNNTGSVSVTFRRYELNVSQC